MKIIILISGVPIEKTPVIKNFIIHSLNLGYKVVIVEYKYKERIKFIFKSLLNIMKYKKYDLLYIVGLQSLPILYFLNKLTIKIIYYWALETYNYDDNNSLAIRLSKIEKYLNKSKLNLIIPIEERLGSYTVDDFSRVIILPNVSKNGIKFINRNIYEKKKIKLLYYGNMDLDKTYIEEIILHISKIKNIELTTIGKYNGKFITENNIKHLGVLSHNDLIINLKKDYHYSIVAYKPINFNWKYCAPNKFYESISCSLPVIANSLNPTLQRLIKETNAGICSSFDNLSWFNYDNLSVNYEKYNYNAYNSYKDLYNFENIINKINIYE